MLRCDHVLRFEPRHGTSSRLRGGSIGGDETQCVLTSGMAKSVQREQLENQLELDLESSPPYTNQLWTHDMRYS